MNAEKWPFRIDFDSGIVIEEHKFYGFWDAGGVTPREGCDTADDVTACLRREGYLLNGVGAGYTSTLPADLGTVACCILSGREFVEQLQGRDVLEEHGQWTGV